MIDFNFQNQPTNKTLDQKFNLFNCRAERKVFKQMPLPNFFYCIVCDTTISGLGNLQQHAEGQKHTSKFYNLKESIIMTQILQFRETNESIAILGLEYIAELANSPYDHEYHLCLLCYVQGKKMVQHLSSDKHNEKYLVIYSIFF